MRRTRLSMRKRKAHVEIESESDESSNDVASLQTDAKPQIFKQENKIDKCDLSESSSDSDIEECMKPGNELNLSCSFFAPKQVNPSVSDNFEAIESNIFRDINRLSITDSESSESTDVPIGIENFDTIELYNAKLNAAKKSIENYEAKKQSETALLDINNLLAAGEKSEIRQEDYAQSSDYESYSDEQNDWEEIKNESRPDNVGNENVKDVEITVEMPGSIAKKKGIDLMASIKRRINRVKKEQQVYIHKVHLLCWIAHGNYVNNVLNLESVQAIALSLLPSQHCYPSSRVDFSYLEQILTWYRKTIKIDEKISNKSFSLEQSLQHQMNLKESHDKDVFVYIFICILRSLGINVRFVMNVIVEPLRPLNSELCPLSNKPNSEKDSEHNSKITAPKAENENKSLPGTSGTAGKPVTLSAKIAKVRKLSNTTISTTDIELKLVETKSMSEDKSSSYSKRKVPQPSKNVPIAVPKKLEINSTKQPSIKNILKKCDGRIISPAKEKCETSVSKSRKRSASSKNEQKLEEKAVTKRRASKVKLTNCDTTEKCQEITYSEDISSINKSSKEGGIKHLNNKRLSERSVNSLPEKRKNTERGGNSKDKAAKPSYQSECEIIDLTANRDGYNKKSGKDSALPVLPSKHVDESNKNKFKTDEESMDNIPKRLLSLNNTDKKGNQIGSKKRKGSIKQVDGPNDSSDDDTYDFVIPQLDGNDSSGSDKKTKPNLRKLKTRSQSPRSRDTYKKGSNESIKALQKSNNEKHEPTKSIFSSSQSSYFSSPDKTSEKKSGDVRDDIINILKTSIRQEKQKRTSARERKIQSLDIAQVDTDSDSDFVPISSEKRRRDDIAPKTKVKQRVLPRKELAKCALSDNGNEKKKKGVDIWVEVFLENEEKWISVDVLTGKVHCVNEIYTRASHPISYILSWDINNYIKDVSQRYCTTNWNTVTRKLRVQPEWWLQTLKPFEGPKTARQKEEDEELEQQQIDQPLPKAISEYKNHPLYVLKRHLLKFEAIYPSDAPALGFIRNEPVYSRMCVYTLHSREIWVKHAKVVKPKEMPYKIVKARPKYDRYSNTFITDQPLEIFGSWQVDDYIPPTAENGVVPKNAYGNVELFKKCMLPKGTVHLDLPGLQKVARKLNIDCPSAVVGFDFHGGWSHPTFEGFIVCEEFADILTAAWYQEQEEAEKREQEKIDKRVYGNWRKLIKGLLIRERLQKRYDFAKPSTSGNKKPKLVLKKNRLCSDSDSD